MIVCGERYTIIKNEKNEIYVCGFNRFWQFGFGDNENRHKFEKMRCNFGKIKNVICGDCWMIVQNDENEIYACGENTFGQFGLGDETLRMKFEKIEHDLGKIKKIAHGKKYLVIQNENDEIYTCGWNVFGQLGLGDKKDRNKFAKIDHNLGKIKNIVCGGEHTIIQNEKNEIYVCGHNGFGQLGLCGHGDIYKFEKVNYDFGGEIKNIACGEFHTIVQNEKNEIYACGRNMEGQLNISDDRHKLRFEKIIHNFGEIEKIICGDNYTIVQNKKNEIYVCGDNCHGQLGLGDNKNRKRFEKVEKNLGEIKNIICGGYHTVIQNKKNEIYVCGCNKYGQLGLGDERDRYIFEKIHDDYIFEITYNFELKLNIGEIIL